MFEQLPRIVMVVGRVGPDGISLLGSCFLTRNAGMFATASHVTQNDDKNLVVVVPTSDSLSEYQDTTDPQVQAIPARIAKIDPIHDTAVLEVDQTVTANLDIGSLDDINVGSSVALFGYPHADQGRKILTMQASEIGAKILLKNGDAKTKHAVINIQTRPGQSGSPVIDVSSKKVVAILIGSYAPGYGSVIIAGIDPLTLHSTSHAVSAEYLRDML